MILELGYFLGKLGRERVVALKRGAVELPSDILGLVNTEFDEHGAWKQALIKELLRQIARSGNPDGAAPRIEVGSPRHGISWLGSREPGR